MPFKDAIGQVIKLFAAAFTPIPLPGFLARMFTPFADRIRVTSGAIDPFRPPQFSYFTIAFFIVDQILDVQHLGARFLYFPFSLSLSFSFRNLLLAIPIEP